MIPLGLALELPAADGPNAVDDLVTRARVVADAGLASLWLGQVYTVDALTALALIGREVPRLALGTAVTTIHSRHPIAMSSQVQTTQAAVGGRLWLGLGVGHRAAVEQRHGASSAGACGARPGHAASVRRADRRDDHLAGRAAHARGAHRAHAVRWCRRTAP
ncbi:LLM class flavin-dependent oxidoreductase [Frankia sp. Ag45/Mut15]|uniref:LLM class flavin-dependent oxidoreductase n=1 Tax=Frankia umida TaxID=573489 RepID=A0ABT0JV65_9ACTN|nr:LLM class flavin-dependent oxidoreductase [Frankia umida]MCK9875445.1 LLM class flavin-dependent oxidoreductase [Frankia umida]